MPDTIIKLRGGHEVLVEGKAPVDVDLELRDYEGARRLDLEHGDGAPSEDAFLSGLVYVQRGGPFADELPQNTLAIRPEAVVALVSAE